MMKLEAKARLEAANLTFRDTLAFPIEIKFANAEEQGRDGAGNTVWTAQRPNGFFTVASMSSKGRLLAEAANNLTRGEAAAMAKYAVTNQLKKYRDSDRAIERYHVKNANYERSDYAYTLRAETRKTNRQVCYRD